jgi:hypothetical protein
MTACAGSRTQRQCVSPMCIGHTVHVYDTCTNLVACSTLLQEVKSSSLVGSSAIIKSLRFMQCENAVQAQLTASSTISRWTVVQSHNLTQAAAQAGVLHGGWHLRCRHSGFHTQQRATERARDSHARAAGAAPAMKPVKVLALVCCTFEHRGH